MAAAKTATTPTTTLADPDYFEKKRLELESKRIEMDAKAQYEYELKRAKMNLDFAKLIAGLKMQESRAKRVSR